MTKYSTTPPHRRRPGGPAPAHALSLQPPPTRLRWTVLFAICAAFFVSLASAQTTIYLEDFEDDTIGSAPAITGGNVGSGYSALINTASVEANPNTTGNPSSQTFRGGGGNPDANGIEAYFDGAPRPIDGMKLQFDFYNERGPTGNANDPESVRIALQGPTGRDVFIRNDRDQQIRLDGNIPPETNFGEGVWQRFTGIFVDASDTGTTGDFTLVWEIENLETNATTGSVQSIFINSTNFPDLKANGLYVEIFDNGDNPTNYFGYADNFNVSIGNSVPPAGNIVATPATVPNVGTSETVALDWYTQFIPAGSTYTITADKAVTFATTADMGSLSTGDDTGAIEATVNGTLGDVTFFLTVYDGGSSVIFSDSVTVTAVAPSYTSSQTAVRVDNASSSSSLFLDLADFANFPSGATYAITSDTPGAINSFDTTSGSLFDPLTIDVDLDGTAVSGTVTFYLQLKDSLGNVFDTVVFTVDAVDAAPAIVTTLFADDFSRYAGTDSLDNDLDYATTGMSGSGFAITAGNVYVETYQGDNNNGGVPKEDSLKITAFESIYGANGFGMSCLGINHNFLNSEISTDGGFSVSLDIFAIDTPPGSGDFPDRYIGFGIGMNNNELLNMSDENGTGGTGPRGAANGPSGRGVSDFYCSISLDDNVQIFADGVLVAEFPVDGDGSFGDNGTVSFDGVNLRTDFSFADPVGFAAGSYVYYKTYANGLLVTSGYFELTNTMKNYVGFSFRAENLTEADNILIGTVSETYPGDPANVDPTLALDNLVVDGSGNVTSLDLSLSGGTEGVLYAIPISPDLQTFQGEPGNGIGGIGASGVYHGEADGSGNLSFPGLAPGAGYLRSGYGYWDAVHWPAP